MFLTLPNHVDLIFNYYFNVISRIIIFLPTREVFYKNLFPMLQKIKTLTNFTINLKKQITHDVELNYHTVKWYCEAFHVTFPSRDIYKKSVWGEQVTVALPAAARDARGVAPRLNPRWFSCGLYVLRLFCTQCLLMCGRTTSFLHLSVLYSFTLLSSQLKWDHLRASSILSKMSVYHPPNSTPDFFGSLAALLS